MIMSNQDQNGRPIGLNYTQDSTGIYAFSADLPQSMTYNGPGGAIDSVTSGPDARGFTYKQTFTYTGANVTGISAWVKQ